jgi:hypothetical protein
MATVMDARPKQYKRRAKIDKGTAILCSVPSDAKVLWHRLKVLGEAAYCRGAAVAVLGDMRDYIGVLAEMLGLSRIAVTVRPSFNHARMRVDNQERFNERTWSLHLVAAYADFDRVRGRTAS